MELCTSKLTHSHAGVANTITHPGEVWSSIRKRWCLGETMFFSRRSICRAGGSLSYPNKSITSQTIHACNILYQHQNPRVTSKYSKHWLFGKIIWSCSAQNVRVVLYILTMCLNHPIQCLRFFWVYSRPATEEHSAQKSQCRSIDTLYIPISCTIKLI